MILDCVLSHVLAGLHAENRPACMVPLPVTTRILTSGGWRTEELLARAVLAAEGVLARGTGAHGRGSGVRAS